MPKFVYRGDAEVYVPDLGRFVKPGDVVDLDNPNHGLFEPARPAKDEKKD